MNSPVFSNILSRRLLSLNSERRLSFCVDVLDGCDGGRDLQLDRREFAAQGSGLVSGEADGVDQDSLDIF